MTTSSTFAKQLLLEPADLSEKQLQQTIDQMLSHRSIDYADFYFQVASDESWGIEDGIIKNGHYSLDRGVGVRAVSGEKTGFAFSDDISQVALLNSAKAAIAISKQGDSKRVKTITQNQSLNLYQPINPVDSLSVEEKIALLKRVDQLARKKDSRIKQVIASLASSYEIILIFNTEGKLISDVRPLVRLNVTVIAEENGKRESGFAGGGRRQGYEFFTDEIISEYVNHAVNQVIVNLNAIDAPAGMMPVVLGPGWPGVILHEAIGHGLEGDANRKGTSAFANKMGEQIASSICTIVDDGTIATRRGSLNIDDEGTPTQQTVLIEKGILKNYMQDKLNARLMKTVSTGNGRRESYQAIPIPRMTNTFMLPGKSDPNEIIASVKKGIYAVNFAGGQVDTTSGKFVFSANEAYLIEKGKITQPIKGATLIGSGPEVLIKVSMVGNNLELDSGIGICGKEGQSVPVGVGQPTIKVDELIIGGTK